MSRKSRLGIIGLVRRNIFNNKVYKSNAYKKNIINRSVHRKNLSLVIQLPNDFIKVDKHVWFLYLNKLDYFKRHFNSAAFSKLNDSVAFYKILDSLDEYKDMPNVEDTKKTYIVRNGKRFEINQQVNKASENDSTNPLHQLTSDIDLVEMDNIEANSNTVLNVLLSLKTHNKIEIPSIKKLKLTKSQNSANNIDNFNLLEFGTQYEYFIANQLTKAGFSIQLTSATKDFGVDILVSEENDIKIAIQCKYWATPIGIEAVQEVFAGMFFYDAQICIVISNQELTKNAQTLANKLGVHFVKLSYF